LLSVPHSRPCLEGLEMNEWALLPTHGTQIPWQWARVGLSILSWVLCTVTAPWRVNSGLCPLFSLTYCSLEPPGAQPLLVSPLPQSLSQSQTECDVRKMSGCPCVGHMDVVWVLASGGRSKRSEGSRAYREDSGRCQVDSRGGC
jgi:hypothetical protein